MAAYLPYVLYLASRSPQRAMLLKRAGVPFAVVDSACNEDVILHTNPQVLALERARGKARGAVLDAAQLADGPAVVIAADTVVAKGSATFGKPANRADAVRILTELQGTTHSVFTGHSCVRFAADGSVRSEAARIAVARVTMKPLTAEEIDVYVASGESEGRAGAYAIQEKGDRFVTDLQGSWDTVVGLTVSMVARLYQECTDLLLPGFRP